MATAATPMPTDTSTCALAIQMVMRLRAARFMALLPAWDGGHAPP
jgi:hypothetical protein